MPKERSTEPSPPTLLRWLKVYLIAVQKMVEDGRLYEEQGDKVAKGLSYSIRALEDSYDRYRKSKRDDEKKAYEEANRHFARRRNAKKG